MKILEPLFKSIKKAIMPSTEKAEPPSENIPVPVFDIKVGEMLESTILSDSIQELANQNNLSRQESDSFADAVELEVLIGGREELVVNLEDAVLGNKQPHSENSLDKEEADDPDKMVDVPPSLLENKQFVKVVEECVDVMNEFEGYIERVETDEGKMIAEIVVKRLQELLERSGLQSINDAGEPFSILRHIPSPMALVSEGRTMEKVLQPGLAIDRRVFRKAKVKILNEIKGTGNNEDKLK